VPKNTVQCLASKAATVAPRSPVRWPAGPRDRGKQHTGKQQRRAISASRLMRRSGVQECKDGEVEEEVEEEADRSGRRRCAGVPLPHHASVRLKVVFL